MKNFLVVASLAVVIVGVGMVAYNQGVNDQGAAILKGVAVPTPTPGASTNSQVYGQLVQQYRTARMQVTATCRVSPTSYSFKAGTSILLDNRSPMTHVVSVGGMSYTLPAYGYQVVALTSPTLPAKLSVNCDSSVNVATVKLSQ